MMDQYDNKYKNQYKQETSQIHAPADLIRKTKQAVAEEEKRQHAGQSKEKSRNSYRQVLKWALPVSAAAILILAVNLADLNGFPGRVQEESGGISDATGMAGGAEDLGGMEDGTAQESEMVAKNDLSAARQELSDSYVEKYDEDESDRELREEEKYAMEDSAVPQTTIEEVKTAPEFCNASDTKQVVSYGIVFYITENADAEENADEKEAESGGWKAYTEYKGKKYIITGHSSDQNEFLERAYKILAEIVEE